ncbi:MAG: DUF1569 domain-containing protein [Xanthomonadales bacterium]|nr:DUF1569 domain-containing protein [Xanthomonadales bacterium]
MKRRSLLIGAAGAAALSGGAGIWLLGPARPVTDMGDWSTVHHWLDRVVRTQATTRSGWSLPVVLQHLAQSIEYSLDGYPELKPGWFRATVGALAGRTFQRLGAMHHGLDEPIPGAPALTEAALDSSAQRLRDAVLRFEAHRGTLQPHFAYGALDRESYARAHLMHVADHAQLVRNAGE